MMKTEEKTDQPGGVIDFIVNENVFVMGSGFVFNGGNVNGEGATIFLLTDTTIETSFGGGTHINVSNIFIKGSHKASGKRLGNKDDPGIIIIEGDADFSGNYLEMYGDMYVFGTFTLDYMHIYGNIYVDGNVIVGDSPHFHNEAKVYYTGNIIFPEEYKGTDNFIILETLEEFEDKKIPDYSIPQPRDPQPEVEDWYLQKGYIEDIDLTNNLLTNGVKVFTKKENAIFTQHGQPAKDIVVVNLHPKGNIRIDLDNWAEAQSVTTGVYYAPNGKVEIVAKKIEGLIIAKNGFNSSTGGGHFINFLKLKDYTGSGKLFESPEDYPFY